MKRLTETTEYPLDTFNRCQLCGHESADVCEFRLWWECDDADQPEPYNILVVCASKPECSIVLENHPRLYKELRWGRGQPGHLSLLCNDCPYRDNTHCTHPDLKANGGEGLELAMAGDVIYRAVVCFHDENDEEGGGLHCRRLQPPFIKCAGLPLDHLRCLEKDDCSENIS